VLLSVYPDEHLVEIKRIAEADMPALKLASVFGSKLDEPKTDRLITDRDTLLCQQVLDITKAQVETVVDPYRITDDAGVKGMSFVCVHRQITSTSELTCQYLSRGMISSGYQRIFTSSYLACQHPAIHTTLLKAIKN
tara:strand:- start:132 stop:542 length:411 start_codon:yes stop_codon:yes gene_type:complete